MLDFQFVCKMTQTEEHIIIICSSHCNCCNALLMKDTQKMCLSLDSGLRETSKMFSNGELLILR